MSVLTAEKIRTLAAESSKDAKPPHWIDYSVTFKVERVGRFLPRWEVASYDFHRVRRREFGPVFSHRLALRIELLLTQHYRNGWDMGFKKLGRFGGGRWT